MHVKSVSQCACAKKHVFHAFIDEQVCYDCLRVFAAAQRPLHVGGQAFCSTECADRAGGAYAAAEGPGGANFARLTAHCAKHRERFPLLAARLACGMLQNGHSPAYEVRLLHRCCEA